MRFPRWRRHGECPSRGRDVLTKLVAEELCFFSSIFRHHVTHKRPAPASYHSQKTHMPQGKPLMCHRLHGRFATDTEYWCYSQFPNGMLLTEDSRHPHPTRGGLACLKGSLQCVIVIVEGSLRFCHLRLSACWLASRTGVQHKTKFQPIVATPIEFGKSQIR